MLNKKFVSQRKGAELYSMGTETFRRLAMRLERCTGLAKRFRLMLRCLKNTWNSFEAGRCHIIILCILIFPFAVLAELMKMNNGGEHRR